MRFPLALAAALALATPALAQHAGHDQGPTPSAAQPAAGAQGAGVVKAVDAKAGAITIHHGPISALQWPAMTMTFKAGPEVLKQAKPGKTVTFTLNAAGDEVVAIR